MIDEVLTSKHGLVTSEYAKVQRIVLNRIDITHDKSLPQLTQIVNTFKRSQDGDF